MEAKKNPKADLEIRKGLFMQIGLILSLLAVYLVLEFKSYDHEVASLGEDNVVLEDEEVIPITERQQKKPPPPPPPPPQEQIVVVKDDVELEEELQMESTETDEDDEVEMVEVVEDEEEEIFNFQVVESQPVFPGCEKKKTKAEKNACFNKQIFRHVRKYFKYPEIAKEMGIQGRVIVKFVIAKDGRIKDAVVLRGVDKNLDKEALRIVSKIPSMTPAKQRGKSVPVSFMLPITFKLQ